MRVARRQRWLGALAVALLSACATPALPTAQSADAERAATRYPGITAAELNRGRELYGARCSVCHRPVAPSAIDAAAWPRHLMEMKDRAGLTPDETATIERYLLTMASGTGS